MLNVVTFAALLGLVYAIVRRRIFDFGLLVNRTLVIAIVGAILLGIFQVAHALIGRYLQFDDRSQALAKCRARNCHLPVAHLPQAIR